MYNLLVKCCFRRATALANLYDADDSVAKWCVRRALTDLRACLYSNEEDPHFAALLARLSALLDEGLQEDSA